jgi:hypothetical protein
LFELGEIVVYTRDECQKEVKSFPKARYKKFNSYEEAYDFAFPQGQHSTNGEGTNEHFPDCPTFYIFLVISAAAVPESSGSSCQAAVINKSQNPLPHGSTTLNMPSFSSPTKTISRYETSPVRPSIATTPPLSPMNDKSLLSLKGVVAGIKLCHSQIRNYISQAEEIIGQCIRNT